MIELIKSYPEAFAIASIVVYAAENIIAYSPLKSNSTIQLGFNIVKSLLKGFKKK